jgi:hypothetical protein
MFKLNRVSIGGQIFLLVAIFILWNKRALNFQPLFYKKSNHPLVYIRDPYPLSSLFEKERIPPHM